MIERIPSEGVEKMHAYAKGVAEINRGKDLKYIVVTYGCQQNEADSEIYAGMLREMGYSPCESEKDADLILVNTCAVREHAEIRALSITGQYKHLKEKNPDLLILICGCMVSQQHRSDDIKFKYPYVDIAFGTSYLWRLPELVYMRLMEKRRRFYLDEGCEGNIAEGLSVCPESPYRAKLSIMYGCNNFCTYCIVPYVRGRERSRYSGDILRDAENYVKNGAREILLLGQNVNSYGKDLDGEDFPTLLERIDAIEGDFLIRFMTSHPKDISKRLIDVMARGRHIAPQLHLPLQSGSNRILKAMNRRYTYEAYRETVAYARKMIPDLTLSSDIIVGFPGETPEDFQATLAAVCEMEYDMAFTFLYSPRVGTPAAEFDGAVPEEEKKLHFSSLLDTQGSISARKNALLVGRTVRVLCEGPSKTDPDTLHGRTPGGKTVNFRGTAKDGEFVYVKITSSGAFSLSGEQI